MKRTEVLCPECFKKKLLKEDSTKDTGSGYCDNCGTRFVFTSARSVRYANAGDTIDQPKAVTETPEPAKPLKSFYATIMSEDPDPDCAEDPHQKYGLNIEATDKKNAEAVAREQFSDSYGDLPIHWVEIHERTPLIAMSGG